MLSTFISKFFQSKKGSNDEKKRKWEEVESQAAGALGVESNIEEENLHQKKKVKMISNSIISNMNDHIVPKSSLLSSTAVTVSLGDDGLSVPESRSSRKDTVSSTSKDQHSKDQQSNNQASVRKENQTTVSPDESVISNDQGSTLSAMRKEIQDGNATLKGSTEETRGDVESKTKSTPLYVARFQSHNKEGKYTMNERQEEESKSNVVSTPPTSPRKDMPSIEIMIDYWRFPDSNEDNVMEISDEEESGVSEGDRLKYVDRTNGRTFYATVEKVYSDNRHVDVTWNGRDDDGNVVFSENIDVSKFQRIASLSKDNVVEKPPRQQQQPRPRLRNRMRTTNQAITYTTKKENETLKTIAKQFGRDVTELVELNQSYYENISRGSLLYKNTKILIEPNVKTGGFDEGEELGFVFPCSICGKDHDTRMNRILKCCSPRCEVCVHMHCLNPKVQQFSKTWRCVRCEKSKDISEPLCSVCNVTDPKLLYVLSGGMWKHHKCQFKSVKRGKKRKSKKKSKKKKKKKQQLRRTQSLPVTSSSGGDAFDADNSDGGSLMEESQKEEEEEEEENVEAEIENTAVFKRNQNSIVRANVWEIIMGSRTDKICPVCGKNQINTETNGFQCAHIDYTRKKKPGCNLLDEIWNLVPSCAQWYVVLSLALSLSLSLSLSPSRSEPIQHSNGQCGQQNMFDFMAQFVMRRKEIKKLAYTKLLNHFEGGFSNNEHAPRLQDLLDHRLKDNKLDFASLVRDMYHVKTVDPETATSRNSYMSSLRIRGFLRLDEAEEKALWDAAQGRVIE